MLGLWNFFNIIEIVVIKKNGEHEIIKKTVAGSIPFLMAAKEPDFKVLIDSQEYNIGPADLYNVRPKIYRVPAWFLFGVKEYIAVLNEGGASVRPYSSDITPDVLYNVNESTILKKGLLEKFSKSLFEDSGSLIRIAIILVAAYVVARYMGWVS